MTSENGSLRYSLDSENSIKSCKSRGSNFLVDFKNAGETVQPSGYACLKDVTLHSFVTVVELVSVPRPNSGAGCRAGGPKKSVSFLLDVLSDAESHAELQGSDADSLAIERTQVNKFPKCDADLTEIMAD